MSIRHAERYDLDVCVEYVRRHVAISIFKDTVPFCPETTRNTLEALIESDVGFVMIGESSILAGIIMPMAWNADVLAASELILYSEGGLQAWKLVKAFEAWARRKGAKVANVGLMVGEGQSDPTKLYERLGFEERERSFSKVV